MSMATVEKAQRLHRDGRVTETTGRTFHVMGDHGMYLVAISGVDIVCDCPASGACSHMTAVLLTIREQAADTANEGSTT